MPPGVSSVRSWWRGRVWVVAALCAGCAASGATTQERIGGQLRTRAFASPTAYEAWLRAELSAARGDPDAALRQLELAAMADPDEGAVAARQVEVLLSQGRVDEALRAAEEARARLPDQAVTALALSSARARRGDAQGAARSMNEALALAPDDPDVRAAAVSLAGGSATQVAEARRDAPGGDARDAALARRALRAGPVESRARRRERAAAMAARGEWAEVERVLRPMVEADPTDVTDRALLIDACARDGRPRDAAPLVAGALRSGAAVPRVERARWWWLAGRADLAAEDAALALVEAPNDGVALRVRGQALLALGRPGEAARALARVDVDARDDDAGEGRAAGWTGMLHEAVPPSTEEGAGRGFALAQWALARALSASGRGDLAARALARATSRLTGPARATSRDALRVAQARALDAGGAHAEARQALRAVETAWGRHRRGAMLAHDEAPAAVLDDLRARTGDAYDDALADAWVALVCRARGADAGCADGDVAMATQRAVEGAPEAPVTLRARALADDDRPRALAWLRAAAARDPSSPWTATLLRRLGARGD